MAFDFARARYVDFSAGGGYESWFIRAADPSGGRAVWIRNTVHQAPGEGPVGSLWFTLFEHGAVVARKQSFFGAGELRPGDGAYVHIGPGSIGRGVAAGAIDVDAGTAAWDLTFTADESPAPALPAEAMYGWPVPRAKPVSLHPATTLQGSVTVDGRAVDVTGWRGCVGHNWGPEHTPEWLWMQAQSFAEDASAWLDCSAGRIRVGPVLTPWLGNGCLFLDGERHRLGSGRGLVSTRVAVGEGGGTFRLQGSGVTVDATVTAPAADCVAWRYSDPADTERKVVHCSIASLALTVTTDDGRVRSLTSGAGAGFEWGSTTEPVSVPVAPFSDP